MSESELPTSLNELIHGHLPVVLQFAIRLTGNVHDAEDIVQESLLRAAKSISTFRAQSSFRTWLIQIVINVFRSHQERKRPVTSPLDAAGNLAAPPAPDTLDCDASETLITRLVNELPARQKEVLVLMTWEQYSAAEVAELLGVTVQNIYSTLSLARGTLRRRLARHDSSSSTSASRHDSH